MLSDLQKHVTNDSALRTARDAMMNAFDEHPDHPTCNVNDLMHEILS